MNIKERIKWLQSTDELMIYPDHSPPETLAADDLKALASSHTKLLEAAKESYKIASQTLNEPAGLMVIAEYMKTAIEVAEKL